MRTPNSVAPQSGWWTSRRGWLMPTASLHGTVSEQHPAPSEQDSYLPAGAGQVSVRPRRPKPAPSRRLDWRRGKNVLHRDRDQPRGRAQEPEPAIRSFEHEHQSRVPLRQPLVPGVLRVLPLEQLELLDHAAEPVVRPTLGDDAHASSPRAGRYPIRRGLGHAFCPRSSNGGRVFEKGDRKASRLPPWAAKPVEQLSTRMVKWYNHYG